MKWVAKEFEGHCFERKRPEYKEEKEHIVSRCFPNVSSVEYLIHKRHTGRNNKTSKITRSEGILSDAKDGSGYDHAAQDRAICNAMCAIFSQIEY